MIIFQLNNNKKIEPNRNRILFFLSRFCSRVFLVLKKTIKKNQNMTSAKHQLDKFYYQKPSLKLTIGARLLVEKWLTIKTKKAHERDKTPVKNATYLYHNYV